LGDRDIVGFELAKIGIHIELLGGAAPAVDLRHPRDRQQTACDDIVLQRAQVGQPEMRRTDNLLSVDFTN
jgi:hypothetical protein